MLDFKLRLIVIYYTDNMSIKYVGKTHTETHTENALQSDPYLQFYCVMMVICCSVRSIGNCESTHFVKSLSFNHLLASLVAIASYVCFHFEAIMF